MARTIDQVKLSKYKISRLQGNCKAQALKDCGMTKATAEHNQHRLSMVKYGDAEILEELDLEKYAKDAFKTLHSKLNSTKDSVQVTAASAILDFTKGKKSEVKDTTLEDKQRDAVHRLLGINSLQ